MFKSERASLYRSQLGHAILVDAADELKCVYVRAFARSPQKHSQMDGTYIDLHLLLSGESTKVKTEKVEAVVSQGNNQLRMFQPLKSWNV